MTEMSKEYGTALFTLAKENKATEEYAKALEEIVELFRANPDYYELLACPSISKSERLEIIDEAFKSMPDMVVAFLRLLCERGRIRELEGSVIEYNRLYDEDKKILIAKVTSCVELTKGERERLKARLEKISGNTVVLECAVDESVLGGLVVEMDGRVLDGTLRHRIQDIKEVISK